MFSLRVALRYLFSRKSHNAVNVISIVSMLGVAIATAAIVCVLSVFNGFADLATARMSAYDPPLRLVPDKGKTVVAADSLAAAIAALPEIAAACPTINEQGLAIFDGAQMAVDMRGIPAGYDAVVNLSPLVIDGEYLTTAADVPVATLSVGVAMRLSAFPGTDRLISLYVPKRKGRINTANPMGSFMADSLFVGGVVRSEEKEIDTRAIYLPLDVVRTLLEYSDGEASSIEISPASGVTEARAAEAVRAIIPEGYSVRDRFQQEEQSFRMIKIEKWITFIMLTFILIIASFNVITTLSMLIIEKTPDISTMQALGATTATLRRVFLWEGWLITFFGGLCGIVVGGLLVIAQQIGGFIKLGGDPAKLSIQVYPVRLDAFDLLMVITLIAVVGFVVGLLTSRFAVRSSAR